MRRSERWRKMKYDLKKENEEIENSFYEPVDMTIFPGREILTQL
jgi:penicillin-binding protein 1A